MRIALVADPASPHTRPWITAFASVGHEVFLFSAQKGEVPPDLGCPVRAPLADSTVRRPEPPPVASTPERPEPPPVKFASRRPESSPVASTPQRPEPSAGASADRRVTWELRWISRALRLVPYFRSWLRETRPDRVLALRLQPEGYLASFGVARPLVVMSWGQDVLHYALGHPLHRLLARRVVRRADLLLGETAPVLAGWCALGATERQVAPGFVGIDLSYWRRPDERERADAQKALAELHPTWGEAVPSGAPVLFSPRAVALRGHQEELLHAFAESAPANALLAQAGSGDPRARQRCLDVARDRGLGARYQDLGSVSRAVLRRVAWASDVVVSLWSPDGLSQSLLEAMACGLFPIAADLPGNREWIRAGENGALVDPSSAESIGAVLATTLPDAAGRALAARQNGPLLAARADRSRNLARLIDRIVGLENSRGTR
jgi:glycosyltransferase involved in cell wall biosynthesis